MATAAIMEGLGATSYKLAHTDGSNPGADMVATELAAKQQEVVQKRAVLFAVTKVLNIKRGLNY